MVGDIENKENLSANKEPEVSKKESEEELDKGYHKEGFIEPKKEAEKELTEEERIELAKKQEEEAINRIIERSKTAKQMSFLTMKTDFFKVY